MPCGELFSPRSSAVGFGSFRSRCGRSVSLLLHRFSPEFARSCFLNPEDLLAEFIVACRRGDRELNMALYGRAKFTQDELLTLVQMVKDRPLFYDKRDGNYKNKILREEGWNEIGKALGRTGASCKDRWRSIRDCYKRDCYNFKRKNERVSSNYDDFSLEFLDEHLTDYSEQRRNRLLQRARQNADGTEVKQEPLSPDDDSSVSEDFILPDHQNVEEIATDDPSTKEAPDQPLVVLPSQSNRSLLLVSSTPTPSSTSTTPQPYVVVATGDDPKSTTVFMDGVNNQPQFMMTTSQQQQPQFVVVGQQQPENSANNNVTSQPQFVVVEQPQDNGKNSSNNVTTQQQPQFVVVGQQPQANSKNSNSNVTAQPQFIVVEQPQADGKNSSNNVMAQPQFIVVEQPPANGKNSSNNATSQQQPQFVVVGQQPKANSKNSNATSQQQLRPLQANANNKSVVKAAAPPKSVINKKKKKQKVVEVSEDSGDDSVPPPKASGGRKKKRKKAVEDSDDSDWENPVDSFFRSMAQTVKSFPPLLAAKARMEVCTVVTRLECEMLNGTANQRSISNHLDCDSASEPKN